MDPGRGLRFAFGPSPAEQETNKARPLTKRLGNLYNIQMFQQHKIFMHPTMVQDFVHKPEKSIFGNANFNWSEDPRNSLWIPSFLIGVHVMRTIKHQGN